MKKIGGLHNQNVLPVIVGGTTYWLQHLLFANRLVAFHKEPPLPASPELGNALHLLDPSECKLFHSSKALTSNDLLDDKAASQLYTLLQKLDPAMAARWHWKDTRKVLRNIQIIKETGRLASTVVKEQDGHDHEARFPTLCIWPFAQPNVLERSLDTRVDAMIKAGLLDEVKTLVTHIDEWEQQLGHPLDMNSGIFQSIGFPEFKDHVKSPTHERYHSALSQMKLSTRKYANYQLKWIKNRLLPAIQAANREENPLQVVTVDTTEADMWDPIHSYVVEMTNAFLHGSSVPIRTPQTSFESSLLEMNKAQEKPSETLQARKKRICNVCTVDPQQPVMLDEEREWEAHCKSKMHKRLLNKDRWEAEITRRRAEAEQRRLAKLDAK